MDLRWVRIILVVMLRIENIEINVDVELLKKDSEFNVYWYM